MATYNTPIIPASDKPAADAFWESAGAGPDSFGPGLVPADGPADATITHHMCSGQLERYFPAAYEEFQVQFPNAVMLRFVGNSAGNHEYVNGELIARNLQRYSPIV